MRAILAVVGVFVFSAALATPTAAQDPPVFELTPEVLAKAFARGAPSAYFAHGTLPLATLPWRFQLGDDPAWADPGFDDSDWAVSRPVREYADSVSRLAEAANRAGRPFIGWFRLRVHVDSALINRPLVFGAVVGSGDVYLDGRRIVRIGNPDVPGPESPAVIQDPLSAQSLVFTRPDAVIAVRINLGTIQDVWGSGNSGYFDFGLQTPANHDRAVLPGVRWSLLSAAIIGFLFALGLLHLLLYAFLRRPVANLHFAGFAMLMGVVLAVRILSMASQSYRWSDRLLFWVVNPSRVMVITALVGFLYAIFYDRFPRRRYLAIWGATLAAITMYEYVVWNPAHKATWVMSLVGLVSVVVLAEGVRVLVVAIRRRREDAWVIVPGSAYFFAVMLLNLGGIAFGIEVGGEWVIFGFFTVALSSSIYLARGFARTSRGYEQLSLHLEDQVRQRTVELETARVAAEAANEAKSHFLANMSHELRTPLNAILGYSEMLVEEAEETGGEELVPDLQKIHASGKHLLELINSVLDLSKVEAGKMDLFLEETEVAQLVKEVAGTVRPLIDQRQNTLALEISPGVGRMRVDAVKLRQMLLNLLSNASKFTESGTIRLTAHREADSEDWLVFEVADTGIGMDEEQQGKLFQPFVQVNAAAARKHGGTGLGLSITRHFAEMMGGSVTVHSRVGEGTVFTIRLPAMVPDLPRAITLPTRAAAALASSDPRGGSEPAANASRGTVLVIDDDAGAREVVNRMLTRDGFRVLEAADGPTGLRIAREIGPDLITLDVLLPGVDGWSVLAALKADATLRSVPVIMMTIVEDEPLGFALGASDYLVKPVDREHLLEVVGRHLAAVGSAQVLVVEDDAPARELMRRTLAKEGWEVGEAENGRVALERIQEAIPGVILLDLVMPEMDGFALLDELQRDERWRRIPVVVVTSKELTEEDRLRLRGGVERILQKGAHPREALVSEVRRLLGQTGDPVTIGA